MNAVVTTFLFSVCISGIVLGDIPQNGKSELITRFDRYRRQAQVRDPGVVPSKVINYYFKDGINQTSKDLFLKANKAWGKYTCVKFIKNNKPMDKMLVTDEEDMCLFMRNRTGRGLQIIHVGCGYFGGVVHEVGHALWLDHTHNRHDRDKYLDVDKTSIMREYNNTVKHFPGLTLKIYMEQYKKLRRSQNKNYGIPYDYGSIMHYGSSGPNPTMTPKDRRYHRTMGSPLISFTDLTMVNKHYNCDGVCERNKSAECKNNGFPNPNNCLICVCPSGYGGTLCEDKPDNCGKVINATKTWRNMTRTIYNKKKQGDYFRCTNWLMSPPNTKIEVEVLEVATPPDWFAQGCIIAGIEVKTNADQRLTGYRFCSGDDANIKLQSESNFVPLITYSMHTTRRLNVTLRYRYVK